MPTIPTSHTPLPKPTQPTFPRQAGAGWRTSVVCLCLLSVSLSSYSCVISLSHLSLHSSSCPCPTLLFFFLLYNPIYLENHAKTWQLVSGGSACVLCIFLNFVSVKKEQNRTAAKQSGHYRSVSILSLSPSGDGILKWPFLRLLRCGGGGGVPVNSWRLPATVRCAACHARFAFPLLFPHQQDL